MTDIETRAIDTELSPPFAISGHDTQTAPVIFNSPHSGRIYPSVFLAASRLSEHALRKSEDAFVDDLLAGTPGLGAVLMQAFFPRAYLDVNREPYELDPAVIAGRLPDFANTHSVRVIGGLGTIARIVNDHEEIYREPLALSAALTRINRLYQPYHTALAGLIERTRANFGVSCLLDCHSMPSQQGGSAAKVDFVLGDRFGASCSHDLVRFVEVTLKAWGFTVAVNKPYAGGYITERYGQPGRNSHALQLEINRALYMDEATFQKRADFDAVAARMRCLAALIIEHNAQLLGSLRLAAE
jgi:N-formylglutamate amidohydrolase